VPEADEVKKEQGDGKSGAQRLNNSKIQQITDHYREIMGQGDKETGYKENTI